MTTGFAWHERMMWHDTGNAVGVLPHLSRFQPGEHYEKPETKRRLKNLLDGYEISADLRPIRVVEATAEEMLRVHSPAYLQRLADLDATGGDACLGAPGDAAAFAPGGFGLARLSAGAATAALRVVLAGEVTNAYALCRPPGHHALPDDGRGACLLANVAIAIRAAQAEGRVGRVAVVDWDVHHGNGTEAIFYEDPSVLTISLHQDRLYPPDSGRVGDRGAGPGLGYNLNLPLPAGSTGAAYDYAFDEVVLPALHAFGPDVVVVACGFDASILDPLGRMMLTSADFRRLTLRLLDLAADHCNGRLLVCHEGGYSPEYVPFCGAAVVEALIGGAPRIVDPLLDAFAACTAGPPSADQMRAVDAARAIPSPLWA